MAGKKKPEVLLYCTVCGKNFWGRMPRKYCSEECRHKATTIRAKDKYYGKGDMAVPTRMPNNCIDGCKGCSHLGTYPPRCCYSEDNGRLRPCKVNPGGGCAVYTTGGRNSYNSGLDKWDWDEAGARELLESGMDVFEVADELGANPNSIKAMLKHGDHGSHSSVFDRGNELPQEKETVPPAQTEHGGRTWDRRKRFNEEEYRKLYALGLTDVKAAKEMDLSVQTVRKWRQKLGLPDNYYNRREPHEQAGSKG